MSTIVASELNRRALMPIGVGTLSASNVLGFDLYIQSEKSGELSLYRRRSHPFTKDDVHRLVARGIRTLFISSGDSRDYRDYVRETILKNEGIPPLERLSGGARGDSRRIFGIAQRRRLGDCGERHHGTEPGEGPHRLQLEVDRE